MSADLVVSWIEGLRAEVVVGDRTDELLEAFDALAAGSRAPLGAIYDRYAGELHALALWRTGNAEDAADVVQDVFVKLATTGADLRRVRDPRLYLLGMTHRAATDRRRTRRHDVPVEAAGFLEAASLDAGRALDAARASRLLATLPPAQREAVYLHHFGELTFRQIGAITGAPTFTAASRYRLAMRRLRALLGGEP